MGEPTRCDLDSIVNKVGNDRQLIEVSVVDHNSGHDLNVLPRLIQRGGMSPTLQILFQKQSNPSIGSL